MVDSPRNSSMNFNVSYGSASRPHFALSFAQNNYFVLTSFVLYRETRT